MRPHVDTKGYIVHFSVTIDTTIEIKHRKILEDDLQTFIQKQLSLYHKLRIDNKGIFPISDLGISYHKILKAKKFACRSLKGKGAKSGIRVIYEPVYATAVRILAYREKAARCKKARGLH